MEVLDANVVREKHRWMEGEGQYLWGKIVEVYAYLALGSSEKQRDILHVVPELAEAGGVRLPFVDLPCIFQGL